MCEAAGRPGPGTVIPSAARDLLGRARSLAALGMTVVVALALLGFAYFVAPAETQGTQNLICVALFLLMFAILPTEALLPPKSWRDLRRQDAG